MSCKLDLKSPIYCFECDPFDKSWRECKAGYLNCEMFDHYYYVCDFSEHTQKSACTCCFSCHYAKAVKIGEADEKIKAKVDQKATVKCSKCNERIYYQYALHTGIHAIAFTTEEVHRFLKGRRDVRIMHEMLGLVSRTIENSGQSAVHQL
jgi:hypothetical protein